MNILVVGGAGYIGSHMTKLLVQAGHSVVVLDNLSTGFESLCKYGEFVKGEMQDEKLVCEILTSRKIDAVMHFAASSQVGESIVNPYKYFNNNVANTLSLLSSMVKCNVKNFIFSSTAAIFGEPQYTPIDEKHPRQPINPYGLSKLQVEQILGTFDASYGMKYTCLRYFNAAGADEAGELGELHNPETHLIPLILQAASGRRKNITVFGTDYSTEDGTCIRDYIHIYDLCSAHLLALNHMIETQQSACYNLGNGQGFTVKQVIDAVKEITQKDFEVVYGERRPGDPAVLVADAKSAVEQLKWQPKYPDIKTIIEHAWSWELKQVQ